MIFSKQNQEAGIAKKRYSSGGDKVASKTHRKREMNDSVFRCGVASAAPPSTRPRGLENYNMVSSTGSRKPKVTSCECILQNESMS